MALTPIVVAMMNAAAAKSLDAGDATRALCLLVKASGATMTLYGKPIEEAELKEAALTSSLQRIDQVAAGSSGT